MLDSVEGRLPGQGTELFLKLGVFVISVSRGSHVFCRFRRVCAYSIEQSFLRTLHDREEEHD